MSEEEKREEITFNSLSRDHKADEDRSWDADRAIFQLPLSRSLGHVPRQIDLLIFVLSTPSLGITEPDSGIFRLSAAFYRGTSSHK